MSGKLNSHLNSHLISGTRGSRNHLAVRGLPALLVIAVGGVLSACGGGSSGGPAPSPSPGTPTPGTPTPGTPSMTFVRRDINSFAPGDAFITAFRQGVAVMQSRPASDPTSWAYQANIHGFPGASGSNCSPNSTGAPLPAWATCQHGNYFFPAWHRMYLYYFERILRAASGDALFALPYWDYENATEWPLPEVFRVPGDASNSLFVAQRNTGSGQNVNGGDPLPGSDTNATLALSRVPFLTANQAMSASTFGGWQVPAPVHFASGYGQLERLPHNAIHNDVGGPSGWMSDPNCAARDPIFWLHHSNIDRLWQVWINQGGGRMNPTTNPVWLNTTFTFFDENGQQVSLSGSQILDTATQLDYSYEGLASGSPTVTTASPQTAAPPPAQPPMLARSTGEARVQLGDASQVVTMAVGNEAHARMATMLRAASAAPIMLTLEGVRQERRGVNYEVYLNLPEGTPPDPAGPYYIGHLSLFSGHQGDAEAPSYDFDVTAVVGGLRQRGEWTSGDARITFVRSSRTPGVQAGATHISFSRVVLHE